MSEQRSRVKRGSPSKVYFRSTVRDAISDLLRDFENRCAYSMQHVKHLGGSGGLHVEHFDPNLKKEHVQTYENLFPVSQPCNSAKGKKWPTEEEQKSGLRFLNCCQEIDYGEQILEDPETHQLVAVTPAASFHLRHCGLKGGISGEYFRKAREERARLWKLLGEYGVTPENAESFEPPEAIVKSMAELVRKMIPLIPYSRSTSETIV